MVRVLALSITILALCVSTITATARDGVAPLSAIDFQIADATFKALAKRQWGNAFTTATGARDPLVGKLARWVYVRSARSHASFAEIRRFATKNPGWPGLGLISRRAEEAMPADLPADEVLAWFDIFPAKTGVGMQRFAEALFAKDRIAEGQAALRDAWVNGGFTKSQERALLRRHKKRIDAATHVARLDRLLWQGQRSPAARMLKRVDEAHRLLGKARLALMKMSGGVDSRIARVPASLQSDPGLWFERVRWRRRKGFEDRAIDLMLETPGSLPYPHRVWREQERLVRVALKEGRTTDAYQLASRHHQSRPAELAGAEWLAGWIALRFLDDADSAYRHFTTMRDVVSTPISVGRASYWAGRAAAKRGKADLSKQWYMRAAEKPTTFYGQLAMGALDRDSLALPSDPRPSEAMAERFSELELVRAVRILGRLGETKAMRFFLARLVDTVSLPAEKVLTATLGIEAGQPHLAIYAAKRSIRSGTMLIEIAYPKPFVLAGGTLSEPALIHAISRQESEMNPRAISPAGARGLMQLMPATAKQIARQIRIPYSKSRLISDPLYNMQLGAAYITSLIDRYDGSYVLALTAYNAGPGRARAWIRTYGDPRDPDVDVIDWIEKLPFDETRNYVQRVLEASQVYRHILSGGGKIPSLELAAAH